MTIFLGSRAVQFLLPLSDHTLQRNSTWQLHSYIKFGCSVYKKIFRGTYFAHPWSKCYPDSIVIHKVSKWNSYNRQKMHNHKKCDFLKITFYLSVVFLKSFSTAFPVNNQSSLKMTRICTSLWSATRNSFWQK